MVSLNIEILEKPWKSIKVTPLHGSSSFHQYLEHSRDYRLSMIIGSEWLLVVKFDSQSEQD